MPEEQEFEPDNSKQESDLSLRDRDVRNLNELLGKLDTFAIDEYFARGRDGVVKDEALDYYVAFRDYERSSEFQIHDKDLRIVIGAFSDAWDVCVAYGDYFFPILSGQAYQFKSHHHTDDPDEVLEARGQFTSDLLDAEREYEKLIEYIKAHYPEVDFKETNRRARESYAAESDWLGEPQGEQTKAETIDKGEVEEGRQRLRKVNWPLVGKIVGAVATAIFLIIACVGLVAGENIYEQYTGRSLIQDVRKLFSGKPIVTPAVAAATSELIPLPEQNGSATADTSIALHPIVELPGVYESFDVCIGRRKWDRIVFETPNPPLVKDGCILLQDSDSLNVATAEDGALVFSSLEPWEDGITLVQYNANCKVREVFMVVSDLQIEGRGWIGLVVDHPRKSPAVISVWLGRFADDELVFDARLTDTHSPLSLNERTRKLIEDVDTAGAILIGVRFEGGTASSIIKYDDISETYPEIALGYPNNFSIVFRAMESSEILVRIDEVRVRWEPEECGPSSLP